MTDLTKAIAELQRISVSKTEHLLAPHDEPFATILNAALSGDLIPRADAELAELATLRAQNERLTGSLRFYADFHENPNDGPWGINSQDFGKEARAALTEGAAP